MTEFTFSNISAFLPIDSRIKHPSYGSLDEFTEAALLRSFNGGVETLIRRFFHQGDITL